MTRRYFVDSLPTAGGEVAFPEDEAAHAARVMRVSVGEPVVLFCGDGREACGEISSVSKRAVWARIEPPVQTSPINGPQLEIVTAIPKGDRAKMLVEKLTEMGVTRLTPLVCQRSQNTPSASSLEKLGRHGIEACKQCGRNDLLVVGTACTFERLLAADFTVDSGEENAVQLASQPVKLIAHPDGQPFVNVLTGDSGRIPRTNKTRILIGPEGGFTEEEVSAAETSGWTRASLGTNILRIETAALAVASFWMLALPHMLVETTQQQPGLSTN